MRQSTVIFATLLFSFLVYITIRDQLPAYLSLFTKGSYSGSGGANKAVDSDGHLPSSYIRYPG